MLDFKWKPATQVWEVAMDCAFGLHDHSSIRTEWKLHVLKWQRRILAAFHRSSSFRRLKLAGYISEPCQLIEPVPSLFAPHTFANHRDCLLRSLERLLNSVPIKTQLSKSLIMKGTAHLLQNEVYELSNHAELDIWRNGRQEIWKLCWEPDEGVFLFVCFHALVGTSQQ